MLYSGVKQKRKMAQSTRAAPAPTRLHRAPLPAAAQLIQDHLYNAAIYALMAKHRLPAPCPHQPLRSSNGERAQLQESVAQQEQHGLWCIGR